jgi:RNA polymerase sigma-70 factor (ECF subfamily)
MGTAQSVEITLERTLPPVSEEAVFVGELQAGSQEAFAYLLAVYQHPVFNLVSHIIESEADAPDVLQDVFVKVFKGIRSFNSESSLKTWIYRIAVHEASNHRRSWIRRHWREPFSVDDTDARSGAASEAASGDRNPYEVLEQAEREEVVKRALASLARPYRTVVVLREIEGLPYEEIAQVLSLAEGTVKSRLLRGRELLRRKLASYVGKRHV